MVYYDIHHVYLCFSTCINKLLIIRIVRPQKSNRFPVDNHRLDTCSETSDAFHFYLQSVCLRNSVLFYVYVLRLLSPEKVMHHCVLSLSRSSIKCGLYLL